jgi:Bacterial aa3 type cytochrome c oxidase subunit IV
MAVDNDLKHHQDTWNLFIKGSIWTGGISATIMLLLLIFVA